MEYFEEINYSNKIIYKKFIVPDSSIFLPAQFYVC